MAGKLFRRGLLTILLLGLATVGADLCVKALTYPSDVAVLLGSVGMFVVLFGFLTLLDKIWRISEWVKDFFSELY